MTTLERNACMESFSQFCEEIAKSDLVSTEEAQYWTYERGYRAAIDELIKVMETGVIAHNFTSPKLQQLASKLAAR
ncbi:MAG: hypothetical protein WBC07_06565 [Methylotenera sp.]